MHIFSGRFSDPFVIEALLTDREEIKDLRSVRFPLSFCSLYAQQPEIFGCIALSSIESIGIERLSNPTVLVVLAKELLPSTWIVALQI
jgi:hypothetical protein